MTRPIVYLDHARDRMAERAVTPEDVAAALARPDRVYRRRRGDDCAEGPAESETAVAVVYRERAADVLVLTCWRCGRSCRRKRRPREEEPAA